VVTGEADPSAPPASTTTADSTTPADAAAPPVAGVHAARVKGTDSAAGTEEQTSAAPSGRGVTAQGSRTAVSGPMTRGSGYLYTGGDVTCPARKQQERQRGLCTDLSAMNNSSRKTMTINAQICNVGTATEVLSYATARELDVTVRRAGLDVWRWSLGRQFEEKPHDVAVRAQECIIWTTEWALVDSHGVRVKAGSYEVVADFDAAEVAGPDRHPSYPITVSSQP
jgi:hypothetical protein